MVVQNNCDVERGLGTWNARPVAKKTWPDFKTNFKDTQTELKVIRGPTIQHTGLHHAS